MFHFIDCSQLLVAPLKTPIGVEGKQHPLFSYPSQRASTYFLALSSCQSTLDPWFSCCEISVTLFWFRTPWVHHRFFSPRLLEFCPFLLPWERTKPPFTISLIFFLLLLLLSVVLSLLPLFLSPSQSNNHLQWKFALPLPMIPFFWCLFNHCSFDALEKGLALSLSTLT